MMSVMKKDVTRFLQKMGVDPRFVSILGDRILINNLRFSRFSRAKEDVFLERYPQYQVSRSKVFQKICTRASRVLKDVLSPKDRIFMLEDGSCLSMVLHAVLESYTRKYGVEIIRGNSWEDMDGQDINSIALPLNLDDEVENILFEMLDGKKMQLSISKTGENGLKLIYPLINVPNSWICSWAQVEGLTCMHKKQEGPAREILEFLSGFIPDVREKMMRSAKFLVENEKS
jgi:hypothetical protein